MNRATPLSRGTVSFLFTDIEGSTRLWEQHPEAMHLALARHDAILRGAIGTHGGHVFKTIGDQFCAAFATAPEALAAALDAQRALQAEPWCAVGPLKVRMALDTGAAEQREGDYFGPPLNRVARLLDAGHGGQILLSQATVDPVRAALPEVASLRDLGAHRLKDLQQPEHLYQLVHPDLPGEFPALRSLEAFAHNLPRQLTSFIGREQQMADVKQLLTTTALLTLTGSGGCGKTRLALQVAADLVEEFADGVWLVELATLADPMLVPQSVASALGVREEPGRSLEATLTEYLRGRSLLLVLDNCEHLIDACAQAVDRLLRACPKLRVLASSREGLGIAGEQTYRVPSLAFPEAQPLPSVEQLREFAAVRLFADRAALSQSTFALTAANAASVVEICQRLDGIPLAIELAAARVKALPVEQLAKRLDDRFRLLTGGSRTALPRQQTLRALIDWSYDLLTEAERTLLRRLSVFAGGWTLEAAEAVCAGDGIEDWEVLDLLTSLVEKSLVLCGEQRGEARYRLLETVRQYSRERLLESGEGAEVRGRHQDWYLALAEQAEPELRRADQIVWLDRLEAEHDNLRVALAWALENAEGASEEQARSGGPDAGVSALRLVVALNPFWQMRGYYSECEEALERALARAGSGSAGALRAKALRMAAYSGEWKKERLDESLHLSRELGDKAGTAAALNVLGQWALSSQGDHEAGRRYFQESLAICTEIGDKEGTVASLHHLTWQAYNQREYERAAILAEEHLALSQELGDKEAIANAHDHFWNIAIRQGEYARATMHLEEMLALAREVGLKGTIVWSLVNLGRLALHQGDYQRAAALGEESLVLSRELGLERSIVWSLYVLAVVAWHQAECHRAAALWEESLALLSPAGWRVAPLHKEYSANLLSALGMVARRQGEEERAASLCGESLAHFRELGAERGFEANIEAPWAVAVCLECLAAQLLQAEGDGRLTVPKAPERVARLLGAAESLREQGGVPLGSGERAEYDRHVAAVRAALGEEALAAAWAEGRAMSLEQAVGYALEERVDA